MYQLYGVNVMPSEFIVFAMLESLISLNQNKMNHFQLLTTYDYPTEELNLIKSIYGRLVPDGSTEISESFFKSYVFWPDDLLYVVQGDKCFVYQYITKKVI